MCLPCCAEANGKNENPLRKHEAQLTILPLQHSKVGGVAALSKKQPTLHDHAGQYRATGGVAARPLLVGDVNICD